MANRLIKLINLRSLALIISLITVISSVQHYFWAPDPGTPDFVYHYTHYNNYLIFKYSFLHLLQHKDLYLSYPGENHYDLFKYSPAFALLMAPFAILPDLVGLILWNTLNGLILLYAFWKFPFRSEKYKILAIAFILVEAITSIENAQSNCLVAGLIILAFLAMEDQKTAIASLLIIACAFIKIFGIAAAILFLFYPGKIKALGWSLLWTLCFLLLPLIVAGPMELTGIYKSWERCLANDYSISYGFSVMAWLYTWFGIEAKKVLVIAGLIIFLIPLLRVSAFTYPLFRQLYLASILIWVVIFNYKSESPTFIIAVSGIAIWFFTQEFSRLNFTLLIIATLFTVLAATDVYPQSLRVHYFIPYVVKVVPCALIWIKLVFDQLTAKYTGQTNFRPTSV